MVKSVRVKSSQYFLWKCVALLSLLTLYGCVGVGVIGSKVTIYDYVKLSSDKGEVIPGTAGYLTKSQVTFAWGEPDEIIKLNKSHTRWIYHRELAWHGIFVFVVVPIPLVVPFGSRNTEVVLEGDMVTSILYHTTDLEPRCLVSLFDVSHSGLILGGIDCSFKSKGGVKSMGSD